MQKPIQEMMDPLNMDTLMAMGDLGAKAAHDINNPLAGIKNCLTLLGPLIPEDHRHFHFLEMAHQEIDRIAKYLKALGQLKFPAQNPLQTFSLKALVMDTRELLAHRISEKELDLEMDLETGLTEVSLPVEPVKRVLYHLLLNAIQASPQGAGINLRISKEPLSTFRMAVKDQGPGVSKELMSKIFLPFYTTKKHRDDRGLGLGLAFTRSLVQSMGGQIQVENLQPCGMMFSVDLPVFGDKKNN